MTPPDSGVLAITTSPHNTIHITLSTKGPRQERTVESEWKIDDRYHPVNDGEGEVLAKWDGSTLIGKRRTETGVEETRFHLGPGGEEMTEWIQSGTSVITLIWRRQ